VINSATIYRHEMTDYVSIGVLVIDGEMHSLTLENPWLENSRNVSCIPAGTYQCHPVSSPRFGNVYEVRDVPGRSHILFHSGNLTRDTQGCILLGNTIGHLDKQRGILQSRPALDSFLTKAEGQPFTLKIINTANTEE